MPAAAPPTEPRTARGRDFVDALAKGLQVLAAFGRDGVLSHGELAERTGLPKATVSRLAGTLVQLGYLARDEEARRYTLGARTLGLGATVQRHMPLQRAARLAMVELTREFDVSVVLGTRDDLQVVMLEIVRPPRSHLTINNDVGSMLPLADSAIGMACLVGTPLRERVELLERLQQRGDDWQTLRARIERAHAERERQRFVTTSMSRVSVLLAAAAPLQMDRGRVFAFSAVGPAFELSRLRLSRKVGPALADMVDRIARDLGGQPASASAPARVRRTVGEQAPAGR